MSFKVNYWKIIGQGMEVPSVKDVNPLVSHLNLVVGRHNMPGDGQSRKNVHRSRV